MRMRVLAMIVVLVGPAGCADQQIDTINTPPSVTIVSPDDAAGPPEYTLGELVEIVASVTDSFDAPPDLTISWSTAYVDAEGVQQEIEIGTEPAAEDGRTSVVTSTLPPAVHTIRCTATDSDDLSASDYINIAVLDHDDSPEVEIGSPEEGDSYAEGDEIHFLAVTTDDDDVSQLTVAWHSNLDGYMGGDPAAPNGMITLVTDTLSAGDQEVTVWVTDAASNSNSDTVAFTIEAPVKELYIDDIRLAVGDHPLAAYPTTEWLLAVAFVGRRHRSVASDGFLVATDALGPLSDDDLRQHTRQMARVRAWLVRLFAEAMRPADKRPPVSLLIFADATDYRAFFTRLGDVWRVYIPLPTSNAYTVQDITGSTYSSHYGIRRPVYLHEAVHAIATRQLHVRTGVDRHTWLHEGLANYLQVAVFPSSVEWRIYTRNFARPIAPDGSTFFKPVGVLLRRHVKPEHYVQLAGLMAYLVEKRPAWLPPLARGLAEGKRVDQILTDLGTTPRALQAEWLAWGKERFPPDAEPKPFPSPQEWTGIKPPAP